MFATAAATSHTHAVAYRQVGVETGVAAASSHQLVQMLFDGFDDALAQALGAMQAGQVEAKCKALGRAVRIVEEGLNANLDLNAGGRLAADLRDLYRYVAVRLLQANLHNDEAALDECRRLVRPLREAWASIAPGASHAD
jgi:flagellar protein FliS